MIDKCFNPPEETTCKSTQKKREPTSGLEPLPCSLRVCGQELLRVARACKFRIDKGFSVPCIAHHCRILHSG